MSVTDVNWTLGVPNTEACDTLGGPSCRALTSSRWSSPSPLLRLIFLLAPPCRLRGKCGCCCWDRIKDEVRVRPGARRSWYSLLAGKRRVSWHRLWWQVIVAVWSVEEGLSALAVPGEGGVKYQPRGRAGLGVQRAATWGRTIFHIKAEKESRKLWSRDSMQESVGHTDNACWCVSGWKVLIFGTALSCSHYYSPFA